MSGYMNYYPRNHQASSSSMQYYPRYNGNFQERQYSYLHTDTNMATKPAPQKEKTPMCLVNELARYNRIEHQYRLTKEEGMPHKKVFTVLLKLGDGEYEAQGSSIKKAQHEAASLALRDSKYKHPPQRLLTSTKNYVTPTVELNALAMKLGEPTIYNLIQEPTISFYHPTTPMVVTRNQYQCRSAYNEYGLNEYSNYSRYSYRSFQNSNNRMRIPATALPFCISLKIGEREYFGEGNTAQTARHNAAKKALCDLRNEMYNSKCEQGTSDQPEDFKSPISAVHEKAFKHGLQTTFEVVDEKGPPHIRIFVTECKVGSFKTVGEGAGKRLSKRNAAEKMLSLLHSVLPPPPPPKGDMEEKTNKRFRRRTTFIKKKTTRIVKTNDKQQEVEETQKKQDVNPITRLMEYQIKRKAREPNFVVIEEKGRGRRKQFTIEVKIDGHVTTGVALNKKDAKREASKKMLQLLGVDSLDPVAETKDTVEKSPTPAKQEHENATPIKSDPIEVAVQTEVIADFKVVSDDQKKIDDEKLSASSEEVITAAGGKQIAPGILLIPKENAKTHANVSPVPQSISLKLEPSQNNNLSSWYQEEESPKDRLIKTTKYCGFEVEFCNLPKGHHHQSFMTVVNVHTTPLQTFFGIGNTVEEAENEASQKLLNIIHQVGLENFFKQPAFIPDRKIAS